MCGPRQLLLFQCDPETPKGWTPLQLEHSRFLNETPGKHVLSRAGEKKSRKLHGKVNGLCVTCSMSAVHYQRTLGILPTAQKFPSVGALGEQSLPGKTDGVPTVCSVGLLSFGQGHFLRACGNRTWRRVPLTVLCLGLQNRKLANGPVLCRQ